MTEPFTLSTFLPYRLSALAERVSARLSVEYGKTHGLSVAEWRVLAHLRDEGPVSVREICDHANLEKSRASRAVSRLAMAGLVRKAPGARDGRLVEISLTADGIALFDSILPRARGLEDKLLDGISREELATFYRVVDQINAILDADPQSRRQSVSPDQNV